MKSEVTVSKKLTTITGKEYTYPENSSSNPQMWGMKIQLVCLDKDFSIPYRAYSSPWGHEQLLYIDRDTLESVGMMGVDKTITPEQVEDNLQNLLLKALELVGVYPKGDE